MSTRSLIGKANADGTIRVIYCHWDGYPEHNGRILKEHYTDASKVEALLDLGDLSLLAPEIGEQHPFEYNSQRWSPTEGFPIREGSGDGTVYYAWARAQREAWTKMCLVYGRDRGESGLQARVIPEANLYDHANQYNAEFVYLFNAGKWTVDKVGRSKLTRTTLSGKPEKVAA